MEKEDFPDYLARLSAAAGVDINGWGSLLAALDNRMDFFAQHGCKVSDHGLDNLRYAPARPEELDSVGQAPPGGRNRDGRGGAAV